MTEGIPQILKRARSAVSDSEQEPKLEEEAEVVEASDSEEEEQEAVQQEEKAADPETEERRKSYRLNKVLGATLVDQDGEEKATRLFVIDISASGFRATDHTPPAEEECTIQIVLRKGEDPFVSPMRVVWVKELTVSGMYQMGCEFLEPEPEQVERLISFIDEEKNKSSSGGSKGVNIGRPWTMIN